MNTHEKNAIYIGALLLFAIFAFGCARNGRNGLNGTGCSTYQAENGAVISCQDGTSSVIMNGQNGLNFVDEIIDPCGDNPGYFDEVLIRLSSGQVLAYFEDGSRRFLSVIPDGIYVTTDRQRCNFTVSNGNVY